ncbi:MAG: T9SS type A sorting domain-containing protein [Bacteroidetes bacterium]|nr:T9SS type A sorting domain-containing protein [Bacteroidota bacterium]
MKKLLLIAGLLLLTIVRAQAQCMISNLRNANGAYVPLNYECPASGFNVTGVYNGTVYSGDAWLKPAPGNSISQLRKPLIFVEGLDLDTQNHDVHRHGSRGWPNFISGVASEIDAGETIFDQLPILLSELNARGYDVFYLDFYDGTSYMQGNSMVLVDLIQKIQANFAGQGSHSIVVAGASMGGQIAKYALAYMENHNMKHCVSDYISIDSPHQGANMPMGVLQMVEQISPLSATIGKFKDYLYTPAPMQLLLSHSYPGAAAYRQAWLSDLAAVGNYPQFCRKVAISNGSKTADALFPAGNILADFKLSSISPCNSHEFIHCGIKSNSGNSSPSLVYLGKFLKGPDLVQMLANVYGCESNCLPCQTAPSLFYDFKSYVTPPNTPPYDNAPGGKRNTVFQIGQQFDKAIGAMIQNNIGLNWSSNMYTSSVMETYHSFIPTVSALDINTADLFYNVNANLPNPNIPNPSIYPFDGFYAPSGNNEFHVEITGDLTHGNIKWTLDELSKVETRLGNTLDATSLNNGTYNFKRTENRYFSNLLVGSGGNLYVNGNVPSDFGAATSPALPASATILPSGSSLTVESCYCPNSQIEVAANGSITLGDNSAGNKGNLIFHPGTKLILRTGSTVTINEGSKLTIEAGADFVLEPNVTILLQGPNALFDVQGGMNQLILNASNSINVLRGTSAVGGTLNLKTGGISMQSSSSFNVDNCKVFLNGVVLVYNQDANFILNGSNALIDVQQTCDISIGSGHALNVKKGTAASGGTLSLNTGLFDLYTNGNINSDQCKILLNAYTFNYFQNAKIALQGAESAFQFGGILNLQNQAVLQHSGDGYFGFKLSWMPNGGINLHGDASNIIRLQGNGKTDKIVEVVESSYVKADETIAMQSLTDGLVEFGTGASWHMASSYRINNVMASSKPYQSGDGFWVSAVPNHQIENVSFKKLNKGVSAYLMWGAANTLRISNCNFEQCYTGIKFVDKGVSLEHLDFWDCHAPIEGVNASTTSYLSYITMHDLGSQYDCGIKLSSAGTAAFYIQNCSINNGQHGVYETGIYVEGTSLTNIKCSNIYAGMSSIVLENYASLNLSPLASDPTNSTTLRRFGGNNNFRSGGGIKANFSNLLVLQDGYNDFSVDYAYNPAALALSGSTFSWINPAGSSTRILPAHNNKWYDEPAPYITSPNHNNTGIPLSVLHKGGGGSGFIDVIDDSPNYKACTTGPIISIPNSINERSLPLGYCPKCPKISGEIFTDKSMPEALKLSLEEFSDTLNPDNLANSFKMFYEIANTSTTYEEERINWNSEFAYLKIKELFGSLVRENKISPLDANNDFCANLIALEQRMIELSKEKDDDLREFYYSIDLATTYRLVGDLNKAMEVLEKLAPCLRLEKEQVEFLNNWISEIQAEQLLFNGAIGIFDFDSYAGMQSSNRVFKKIGNTQANIDTVVLLTASPASPAMLQVVNDHIGNRYSISTQSDSGNVNYHLRKADANNHTIWEQDFDGRNKGVDSVKAILIDDNERVYLTGKSWNGVDFDVVTLKYDSAGNHYWTAKYNDMLIGNDEPIGFEIDSTFHMKVYVRSYNDTLEQFKTIYYTQCDSNCAQNYRLLQASTANSIESETENAELSVFPNPASDKLQVLVNSSDLTQVYTLNMYDVTGKLVFTKSINYKYVMDISKFTKGLYQLTVVGGPKLLKKRVLIN